MAAKILPSPEVLRQLLRYEPETGKLFWLPRTPEFFTDGWRSAAGNCANWNARYAGKLAFCVGPNGYAVGSIFDVKCIAHRVIWALVTGAWPEAEIDHIDGDRANNKWANLRQATRSQNQRNTGVYSSNTSGFKGVSWDSARKMWRADIMLHGKRKHLGMYENAADGAKAYAVASQEIHLEFGRTQ